MSEVAEQTVEEVVQQPVRTEPRMAAGKVKECIYDVLENYFSDLNGHKGSGLYQLLIKEVERPLLEMVLRHTRGNQTKASEMLGINRGTLRKKLRDHGLD